MTIKLIEPPSFSRDRQVSFVGGEGIIRSFKYEDGTWKYLVEMPLAPVMPEFGRIGAETIVLLDEVELAAIGN
jgi:hypothetical protein